jgi:formylglycine-generating enzyme required for sulfatase activity
MMKYWLLFTFIMFAGCGKNQLGQTNVDYRFNERISTALNLSGIGFSTSTPSPGLSSTPEFEITGLQSGHIVFVYSDATCSSLIKYVVSSGTSLTITANADVGSNNYYFRRKNAIGEISECSSAVNYVRNACPDGYLLVPYNSAVGTTKDFCVMQFEARDDGSGVPTSVESEAESKTPWVSISHTDADTECGSLGGNYHLITNPEWMTIARNIEVQPSNWSSGSVGTGCLFTGNSGETTCGYNKGSIDFDDLSLRSSRAKLKLSNGNEIWDFSGNVFEWVDWTVAHADKMYDATDGAVDSWQNFELVDTQNGTSDDMAPTTWQPITAGLTSTSSGIGYYYPGNDTPANGSAPTGYAGRGGWYQFGYAGVYFLSLDNGSDSTHAYAGFRCVYSE